MGAGEAVEEWYAEAGPRGVWMLGPGRFEGAGEEVADGGDGVVRSEKGSEAGRKAEKGGEL